MEKGLQIGGLTESGFRKHVALRVPSLCSASDRPSHLLLSNSPDGCAFAGDSKAGGLWPRAHQAWLKVLIPKTADSVKLILNIDTLSSQPQRSSWTLRMPVARFVCFRQDLERGFTGKSQPKDSEIQGPPGTGPARTRYSDPDSQ